MNPPRRPVVEDTRILHLLPVAADSTTVAAVGPDRAFAYSDADWREIKCSLARVSIDADVKMVGDRWWAQPDPDGIYSGTTATAARAIGSVGQRLSRTFMLAQRTAFTNPEARSRQNTKGAECA